MKCVKILSVFFVFLFVFNLKVFAISDTSSASVILNADTLEIIYQNNSNSKRSMASTTKIMTGLLLAESGRLEEIICITAEMVAVEGSAMGLRAGDYISGRDLLYGLMLMSGNDAANATAHFLAGNNENFAKMMNDKAKLLGLSSTNFVTPSGLDSEEHYTTAYDLAVLSAYALKNEEFAKAVSSKTANVRFGNPMVKYTIKNHNRLLKEYDGCIGVKTGFTKKSGRCLVSAAKRGSATIVVVTLNDPNDWRDHKSMLDYGFEALTEKEFTKNDIPRSITVFGAEEKSAKITIDSIAVSVLKENIDKLTVSVKTPKFIFAPISKGETVGRMEILYNGKIIAKTDIIVEGDLKTVEPRQMTFNEKFIDYILFIIKSF